MISCMYTLINKVHTASNPNQQRRILSSQSFIENKTVANNKKDASMQFEVSTKSLSTKVTYQ